MNQPHKNLSRRTLFAGAGTLGGIAIGASLIRATPVPAQAAALPKEAPVAGGGYSLSEHVKRYYKTALV